jgi:hypothetical protein
VDACLAAAGQGQRLRDGGKLQEALEQVGLCVDDRCPAVVKRDCSRWLGEVRGELPTVVLHATTSRGEDLVDVHAFVDGTEIAASLDGRALPVNPGVHKFRFDAGGKVSEQTVVVGQGEKDRRVSVVFSEDLAPAQPPRVQAVPAPPITQPGRRPPIGAYVLGGVGVLALASTAFFGIRGIVDWEDEHGSCAPRCSPSQVEPSSTAFIVADISLGITAVAGGVSLWLFLSRPSKTPVQVGVAPIAGGLAAGMRGQF